MVKYLDEKGLSRALYHIKSQLDRTSGEILNTKGRANGIASLDSNGFVPLDQLGNLDLTFYEVVTELPTTKIKKHIYAIKNNKEKGKNSYTEYIYTGNIEGQYDAGKWEELGDFVPSFDLKEYSKKEETITDLCFTSENEDGSVATNTPDDKLGIVFSDGRHKILSFPLATASRQGGIEGGIMIKPIIGSNGFMSRGDKEKLDKIDTEALSQSISNANTAADNTNDAISACKTATEGAEKVNARLDGNVLTVTNRNGKEESVNLTDSDEHVTVNCTTTLTDTSVEGLVINVYVNNGSDPHQYTTDSNGQATFTVTKGSTYKVVFPYLKGANIINPKQFVAAVGNRIIDAEYVAETEKFERVTVQVRKADDDGNLTPWESASVYVTISNTKTTYTTDADGKVQLDVKNGTSYTVAVDKMDGLYEQYDRYSITRTAIADSYRFNFIYRPYESGIWLVDDENKHWTYDDWVTSGNDSQRLVFVCIKTLSTQRYNGDIYIGLDALRNFTQLAVTKTWCSQNVQFNNIPLNGRDTNNSSWSKFAYNALLATETIIAEGDERELPTPACDYAYGFKVQNGELSYQGYLPTAYQWETAWQNIDFVLDCLSLKFPSESFTRSMFSGNKWTSTQSNAANSYYFYSSVSNGFKTGSTLAFPVFACLSLLASLSLPRKGDGSKNVGDRA